MKNLLIAIVLVLCFSMRGQVPIYSPVYLEQNLTINELAQDSIGFLWMATNKGLYMYNGYEDALIPEDSVSMLYSLEIDGNIAYAGSDSGLVKIYNIREKSLIGTIQTNSKSYISDLIKCASGNLIIATYGSGIYNYSNGDHELLTKEDGLSSDYVYDIEMMSDGKIIIATDRGMDVANEDLRVINSLKGLPDIIITNLSISSSGVIWASSYDRSIFSLNPETYEISNFSFDRHDKVLDLITHNEEVIFSTEKGLWILGEGKKISSFGDENLVGQQFNSLLKDNENNLWLASNQSQLWKGSLYFNILELPVSGEVQSVAQVQGRLYLGTNDGLYLLASDYTQGNKILDNINITSLKNINNNLWIGTYSNGYYVLEENGRILYHDRNISGLKDNTVLDIEQVNHEKVIISTLSGVIEITYKKVEDNLLLTNSKSFESSLGYSYVLDVSYHNGQTWLGRDRAGFIKYDGENSHEFLFLKDSIEKIGSVHSIASTSENDTWISSTNYGLLRYYNDTIIKVANIKNGDETYSSIIPINNNNLLLIRASSIDLYNIDKGHTMYYNSEAKINSNQAFLNNYCILDDKVFFVHNDKLYQFKMPAADHKIHPTTSLDKVEVNLDVVNDRKSTFAQGENNFRFSYTGAWLSDPSKISYNYTLEGFDQFWRETKDRVITYPHLPPGSYTFMVKSAENEDFSDEPIASYGFRIKRAFHNTIWFYLLVTSLLVGLIYWLIKRDQRERNLRAELAQKQIETQLINLKAQLNPHFLFNSFNTLIGLVEEDKDKGIKYVEYLTDFYRAILEVGKDELIPLEKELNLVELYSYLLKERFGKGLIIEVGEFDRNSLIPPLTLQMLVENAVKHNIVSQKQPLHIKIFPTKFSIVVTNNLNPKVSRSPSTNIGLQNIKRRYLLLKGKAISVIKTKDEFTLELPFI